MIIEEDIKLDFNDVLLKPKRSTLRSRSEVELLREFKNSAHVFSTVPIIAANMDTIGTFAMATALNEFNCMTAIHKHYDSMKLIDFFSSDASKNSFYSMGTSLSDMDKFSKVFISESTIIEKVCIDVANGYTETFLKFVKLTRDAFPEIFIMAGNVVTPEMTEELILAGVNCVKVGIGSGSSCLTRNVAGVGMPQLSAIIACADAAHGLGGYICADGGCVVPGDIVKAIGAGADFVMIGGMLSGSDESDGKVIICEGVKYKEYYGMSSDTAMNKHSGGVNNYRASEGKTVKVKSTGRAKNTMNAILGGVRSAMTYIGAKKIKEVPKRTTFIRVNRQLNNVFNDEI